jgi:hypothetical protein
MAQLELAVLDKHMKVRLFPLVFRTQVLMIHITPARIQHVLEANGGAVPAPYMPLLITIMETMPLDTPLLM